MTFPGWHDVEIIPPDDPGKRLVSAMYTVLLDGKEVRASGITVRLRPPESITLEIDLPYVTLNTLRGRAQVVIDPAVEDTLISLGWTPPAPDLPTERVPRDALAISDDHDHECDLRWGRTTCTCGAYDGSSRD